MLSHPDFDGDDYIPRPRTPEEQARAVQARRQFWANFESRLKGGSDYLTQDGRYVRDIAEEA